MRKRAGRYEDSLGSAHKDHVKSADDQAVYFKEKANSEFTKSRSLRGGWKNRMTVRGDIVHMSWSNDWELNQ